MGNKLVTILKRQADILNQIEKDRETIRGKELGARSTHLVAVEPVDSLQHRIGSLQGIARAERAIEEGRLLTHKQAKQRMSRWLK